MHLLGSVTLFAFMTQIRSACRCTETVLTLPWCGQFMNCPYGLRALFASCDAVESRVHEKLCTRLNLNGLCPYPTYLED